MRTHPVTRRYARALFELAIEKDILDQIVEEVAAFLDLLESDAKLRAYLLSPEVKRDKKEEIIKVFVGTQKSDLIHNFLLLLIRKGRQRFFAEIAFEFDKLVDKKRKLLRASVTSAVPLLSESIEKIKAALSRSIEGEIVLDSQVDPKILGGVIVRYDGKVIDGSVRQQLQRLEKRLVSTKVDSSSS